MNENDVLPFSSIESLSKQQNLFSSLRADDNHVTDSIYYIYDDSSFFLPRSLGTTGEQSHTIAILRVETSANRPHKRAIISQQSLRATTKNISRVKKILLYLRIRTMMKWAIWVICRSTTFIRMT